MKEGRSDVLADVVPSLRAMVYEAGETWPYAGNEADWEFITAMLAPIPEMAEAAARGENPLVSRRGCFLRAYVSEYDGSVRSYAVYVPDGYDGSRAFPLIIALHGAGGDHWSGLKMVTGSSALIVGAAESNEHFFPRRLPPDFIIACPGGHGYHGPGYKGPAEYDALKVLKEMMSSYNIDADRVYLTGSSKGGHGTWEIGLKYPELFAAIAPVCGATDAIRSLAGGAGCGLRIYVFHGAKDRVIPVDQSRVMVAMLLASGAQVEYVEYPDLGHEASSLAYRDDAVIEVFRK
jgi:predicted peptidase